MRLLRPALLALASATLIAIALIGCTEWTRRGAAVQLAIASLSPSSIPVGSDSQILMVRGSGFSPASIVALNGDITQNVKFVSPSQLKVEISKGELQNIGDLPVSVTSGGETVAQYLRIEGGTLEVRIDGLPAEQQGNISITSESGLNYRISGTQRLQVPPGNYLVSGNGVGSGGSNYYSEPAAQPVTIEDGSASAVEVSYKMVTLRAMQNEDPKQGVDLRMMLTD